MKYTGRMDLAGRLEVGIGGGDGGGGLLMGWGRRGGERWGWMG